MGRPRIPDRVSEAGSRSDCEWTQGLRRGQGSRDQRPDGYNWRRQDKIDKGIESGVTTEESAKLKAAKKKITALETELAIHRRASELLKERHDPKVGRRPSK